jgi:hypothetical protein
MLVTSSFLSPASASVDVYRLGELRLHDWTEAITHPQTSIKRSVTTATNLGSWPWCSACELSHNLIKIRCSGSIQLPRRSPTTSLCRLTIPYTLRLHNDLVLSIIRREKSKNFVQLQRRQRSCVL